MKQSFAGYQIYAPDESAIVSLAGRFWTVCRTGDVIALWGDLGAGKTSFARGFIRATTHPAEDVPSPTFTLLQTYEASGTTIYHFDFYRIESPEDVVETGIEAALADGVSMIEWPGKMGYWLPRSRLDIAISIPKNGEGRIIRITDPAGTWGERLMELELQASHEQA